MFIRFFFLLVGFGISILSGCMPLSHSPQSFVPQCFLQATLPYSSSTSGIDQTTILPSALPPSYPSDPTLSSSKVSPWFFIAGVIATGVGAIGMLSPNSCGQFTSDGRCMSSSPPQLYWSMLTLGGITLTLVGWIHWKEEYDTFDSNQSEEIDKTKL